ncbi:unnamed protein product [Meganyctiphanes norvegica]|uniref:Elongation of very long chain fatty acids protein n=1 Tax=Meganyctiphanes norvegica TaxID=48144 RepID=A0AAV2QHN9_MEGNR
MPPQLQGPGTCSSDKGEDVDGAPSLGAALMSGVFACVPQQDNHHNHNASLGTSSKDKEEEKQDEAWEEKKEAELRKTGYIALVICTIMFFYGKLMVESSLPPDPRQEGWLMMMSPIPTFLMAITFIVGVTMVGPKLMHGRKPVEGIKKYMVFYNMIQVIFSAWQLSMLVRGGWFNGYSLRCEVCDYSDNPKAVMMLHGGYWYFISKFVDFTDTFFMVVNKKYNQITPLHVIHHSVMAVNMYFGIRYMPGGHSTFLCVANSFVHVVMYFYYGLSAMGPRIRPYLWWKRHLTKLQIVQFIAIIIHASQLTFTNCDVPSAVIRWVGGTTWLFLYLFIDFYIKAYLKNKERKNEKIKKSAEFQHQGAGAAGSKTEMMPLISEEITTITRREHKRLSAPLVT